MTQGILDTVLRSARQVDARRVARIRLVIGEFSDLQQEWLQRYFDYLSKGTIAEDAEILIRRVPAAFACMDCGGEFDVDLKRTDRVRCPVCRGSNCRLVRGREFLVDDMEVEV